MEHKGLIQVYTGAGKGKTTAALGLALRAVGCGWKIAFIQFLKGSSYTGELFSTARFGEQWHHAQFGWGCPYSALIRHGQMVCSKCGQCFRENRDPEYKFAPLALAYAKNLADTGQYQLMVLDEISHAIRRDLLTVDEVLEFLHGKPSDLEIVLTGRHMASEILAIADLVTELAAVKHPLEKGIPSRRGIEY